MAAITLIWPTRQHLVERAEREWRGPAFAAACMVGGAVVVGGIAYISIGMADESRRVAAWREAHDSGADR